MDERVLGGVQGRRHGSPNATQEDRDGIRRSLQMKRVHVGLFKNDRPRRPCWKRALQRRQMDEPDASQSNDKPNH